MYYPEELVEEVRARNDIVDVIGAYVPLRKKGSSYLGLCPFHGEKTPSFSVSREKQMYYCFGCGAGGNLYTFLMEYENCSFPEAIGRLADRAGITLPKEEYGEQERREQDLRSRILELNKTAANYYYLQLRSVDGAPAMRYLRERGLSDETVRAFGLGFANRRSDDLYRYLKSRQVPDELLRESGLMNVDERRGMYDKFWNRVIFPIQDVNGKVIGFGGRVIGEGKPKYLNSPETRVFDKSRTVYGLHLARRSRKPYLLLCEGYMDVISLHQAGFDNAVASLGTAFTQQHASLLKRCTDEVILTYDSDEAGVHAALSAIPLLKQAGLSAKVLHLEPYKDPDELIKAQGAKAYQERIDQAENSFLFSVAAQEKHYDMKDPEGKTAFFQMCADRLTEFDQELERENYIEAVAQRYRIGCDSLRRMVNRAAMRAVGREEKPPLRRPQKKKEKDAGIKKSQGLLLTWLAEDPNLYRQITPYLSPDDFTGDLYRETARLLFAQLEKGEGDPARILDHFTDPEQHKEVAALFHAQVEDIGKEKLDKALNETVQRIRGNSIDCRMAKLEPDDLAGLQMLLRERRETEQMPTLHMQGT